MTAQQLRGPWRALGVFMMMTLLTACAGSPDALTEPAAAESLIQLEKFPTPDANHVPLDTSIYISTDTALKVDSNKGNSLMLTELSVTGAQSVSGTLSYQEELGAYKVIFQATQSLKANTHYEVTLNSNDIEVVGEAQSLEWQAAVPGINQLSNSNGQTLVPLSDLIGDTVSWRFTTQGTAEVPSIGKDIGTDQTDEQAEEESENDPNGSENEGQATGTGTEEEPASPSDESPTTPTPGEEPTPTEPTPEAPENPSEPGATEPETTEPETGTASAEPGTGELRVPVDPETLRNRHGDFWLDEERLRRAVITPDPTVGMINVFFRKWDPATNKGQLCRMKGPALDKWDSDAGREAGYETNCFGNISIDRPPQVVLDPRRRKLHVFALKHTGDLGGAMGLVYSICNADSMECKQRNTLMLESKTHHYPSVVFVPGQTPQLDKIIGFYDGGYGGQLGQFVIGVNGVEDPNDAILNWNWVGDRTDAASKAVCGNHTNIDRSPHAIITQRNGQSELHIFGRAGHGNPLHAYLDATEFTKLQSNLPYTFRCQKFDLAGHPRFLSSPFAISRNNNRIDIIGTNELESIYNTAKTTLWPFQSNPAVHLTSQGNKFGERSVYLAPEERITVVTTTEDPESPALVFTNEASVSASGRSGDAFMQYQVGPEGKSFSSQVLPFAFRGSPAAVRDSKGQIHLFGADAVTSNNLLPVQHRVLNNGTWSDGEIVGNGLYLQSDGRFDYAPAGVTAIWVPSQTQVDNSESP